MAWRHITNQYDSPIIMGTNIHFLNIQNVPKIFLKKHNFPPNLQNIITPKPLELGT